LHVPARGLDRSAQPVRRTDPERQRARNLAQQTWLQRAPSRRRRHSHRAAFALPDTTCEECSEQRAPPPPPAGRSM